MNSFRLKFLNNEFRKSQLKIWINRKSDYQLFKKYKITLLINGYFITKEQSYFINFVKIYEVDEKKKTPKALLGFISVFIIAVLIAYFLQQDDTLPIYNPADINPSLVDESVRNVRNNHRISHFELINQLGDTITEKTFEGKIYVADFFFTRCMGICPKMTKQMDRAAEELKDENNVMFLSHSVTPVMDSVPILAAYAELYGANPEQWMLVTGDKKQIYDLARKFYFAVTTEGEGGETDFIHTENFILIDKEKRIRGFYDGTSQQDVDRLIGDIRILLKSYQ